MLDDTNSNQIQLTCVPYREPQAQPVVVNINQAESQPIVLPRRFNVNTNTTLCTDKVT
jgi:hypothetical protein